MQRADFICSIFEAIKILKFYSFVEIGTRFQASTEFWNQVLI